VLRPMHHLPRRHTDLPLPLKLGAGFVAASACEPQPRPIRVSILLDGLEVRGAIPILLPCCDPWSLIHLIFYLYFIFTIYISFIFQLRGSLYLIIIGGRTPGSSVGGPLSNADPARGARETTSPPRWNEIVGVSPVKAFFFDDYTPPC